MRSRILTLVVVIVLVAVTVGVLVRHARSAPRPRIVAVPPQSVQIVHPERQTVRKLLELPGTVDAWYKARLFAKVSGYLRTIRVDKGDPVTRGELLATIWSPELEQQATSSHQSYQATTATASEDVYNLAKARAQRYTAEAQVRRSLAQVRVAQADVAKAKADLALGNVTYSRLKQVYDRDHGLIARQDLDVADATQKDAAAKVASALQSLAASGQDVQGARSELAAATVQVGAVQQQVQQDVYNSQASGSMAAKARQLYDYTRITAPFSGVITARFLDPGALVQDSTTNSQASVQPVVSLQDIHVVRIYVQVPESDCPDLHPVIGTAAAQTASLTKVAITSQEMPGRTWNGTVTRTAEALDDDSRTMLTEIDVPNPDSALKPGMMVQVTLQMGVHPNVLTVPTTALATEDENRYVFVESNSKVKRVTVKTGFEEPLLVEVTHGLRGDENVVRLAEGLKDGDAVQVEPSSPGRDLSIQ